MKNWTITSNLVTLSLGALISACGAAETGASNDQPGLESGDSHAAGTLGEVGAALTACDDPQYDHWRYISALGVAAGNELGRWNIADFTNSNGVQLSASGLARCKAGCPNIQAILSLQNNGKGIIPRLDPGLLKQYLTGFYTDQVSWQNVNGYNEHVLVPTTVTPASCGYRYSYRDTLVKFTGTTTLKPAVSGKCIDISSLSDQANVIQKACSAATQQNFVVEPILKSGYRLKNVASGKCALVPNILTGTYLKQQSCGQDASFLFDVIDAGGGKYRLQSRVTTNQCVEVANSSTADGTGLRITACNAASAAQQFTATLATQTFDNPNQADMVNTLRFVGGNTQNPYIQFQSTALEVSMDPLGTMVDGGASGQTGSCTDASSAFDTTRAIAGKCCTYSGKYGTFQPAAWNANLFYCK